MVKTKMTDNNKVIIFFKSTNIKENLTKKIITNYKYFLCGFYTIPVKENDKTICYDIVSINGNKKILAGKNFISSIYLNKYSINISAIDEIALNEIENSFKNKKIILIDEFGSFFLKYQKFIDIMIKLFNSDVPAIIMARKINEIYSTFKNIDNVLIFEINEKNYTEIFQKIELWIYNRIKTQKFN